MHLVKKGASFFYLSFSNMVVIVKVKVCLCQQKLLNWTKYFVAGAGEKKLLNQDQKCILNFPPRHRDGQDSLTQFSVQCARMTKIKYTTVRWLLGSVESHGKNYLETSEGFICCGNFNYGHPTVRDCLTLRPLHLTTDTEVLIRSFLGPPLKTWLQIIKNLTFEFVER